MGNLSSERVGCGMLCCVEHLIALCTTHTSSPAPLSLPFSPVA
jgi:hypothetical protein